MCSTAVTTVRRPWRDGDLLRLPEDAAVEHHFLGIRSRHFVLACLVLQCGDGLEPLVRTPVRPVVQTVAAAVGFLGLRLKFGDEFGVQRQGAGTELFDVLQGVAGVAGEFDVTASQRDKPDAAAGHQLLGVRVLQRGPGVVGVDQDCVAALVAGEMLSGLQQLPPHALAPEFRKDVEREFGEVEVVHERQGDVHRPDDHAVDLGHEDHLAFVGVRHLQ